MDIAVLGMGRALAGRLLEGRHRVTVWNRSTGKARELMSAGARAAQSVADDAVEGVDVVFSMVANDVAVRAVAFGELRSSIGEEAIYVDSSTVSRKLSRGLGEVLPARLLAMPVVGSHTAVSAVQAVFLVGDTSVADRLGQVRSSPSATVQLYDTTPLASLA